LASLMWYLITCVVVGVIGSLISSYLPYYLIRRGVRVSKAIKVATLTTGLFVSLAIVPAILIPVLLTGLLGLTGLAAVALYLIIQYLITPYVLTVGTEKVRLGSKYGWVLKLARDVARDAGYSKGFEVRIVNSEVPNAYAVGNVLKRSIVIHEGLLKVLSRDEVKAVIAHELGHLAHHDNSYMLATSFTPMLTYLLGLTLLLTGYVLITEAPKSREEGSGAGLAGLTLVLLGAVVTALAMVLNIAVLAFSRVREHMADIYSVRTTRNDAIATALDKIRAATSNIKVGSTSLVPKLRNMLYIVPQLSEVAAVGYASFILSTHPPIYLRKYVVRKYLRELSQEVSPQY